MKVMSFLDTLEPPVLKQGGLCILVLQCVLKLLVCRSKITWLDTGTKNGFD